MKIKQLTVASLELQEAMAWYRKRSPRAAENLWLSVQNGPSFNPSFPMRSAIDCTSSKRASNMRALLDVNVLIALID